MKNATNRILPPVALLTLALAGVAQQANPDAPPKRGQAPHTLSVDFKGGTLAEYVAALRAAGTNVNVVLPDSATKVRVPALVLRETSVEAALRAVTTVVDPSIQLNVNTSVGTLPNQGPIGEPVYSVQVRQIESNPFGNMPGTAQPSTPSARVVRVFALRSLLKRGDGSGDGLEVKTILTAVDTGLSVVAEHATVDTGDGDNKAVVRYHEDSALLFVSGTVAQLRVIDEVISNLRRDTDDPRPAKRGPSEPKAGAEPPAADDKRKVAR